MDMDKEVELLPILQRFDSLAEDVKLMIDKLEQIKKNIKELRKEILEIWKEKKKENEDLDGETCIKGYGLH